jgi:hypothetical protein
MKIVRIRMKRVHIHSLPPRVDICMLVTVRVRNTEFYSMDYKVLEVVLGYRGKKLGHVRSRHGHVRARGSSYVDAELAFDGVELMGDLMHFLEDLAKGTVPFETVTKIEAQLGLLFFHIPLVVIIVTIIPSSIFKNS